MSAKYTRALILCTGLISGASVTAAEISANVSLVSQYVFRGVNFSDEDPAIQGGFDYSHGGFYAGVWGSSDTGNGEFDFYGGYQFSLTPDVQLDLGVTRYYYPIGGSTTEFYAGIAYQWLGFTYYYDETLEQDYIELSAGFDLSQSLALNLRAGRVSPDVGDEEYDTEVSLSYALNDQYSAFITHTTHESDAIDDYVIVGFSGSF